MAKRKLPAAFKAHQFKKGGGRKGTSTAKKMPKPKGKRGGSY